MAATAATKRQADPAKPKSKPKPRTRKSETKVKVDSGDVAEARKAFAEQYGEHG